MRVFMMFVWFVFWFFKWYEGYQECSVVVVFEYVQVGFSFFFDDWLELFCEGFDIIF